MLRRDFVRTLFSLVFASKISRAQEPSRASLPAPAPVPWTLGLNPLTPLPQTTVADEAAQALPAFFNARQMETLTKLCNLLLPPLNGKPGAAQAGTPQFLDFFVGGSADTKKDLYTGGLDWLDAHAEAKYQTHFALLSEEQAGALVKPWLRVWMSDHPPTERYAGFINIVQDEIRTATANSQAWAAAASASAAARPRVELYWSPIEPDGLRSGAGCEQAHILALPAARFMPTYPR